MLSWKPGTKPGRYRPFANGSGSIPVRFRYIRACLQPLPSAIVLSSHCHGLAGRPRGVCSNLPNKSGTEYCKICQSAPQLQMQRCLRHRCFCSCSADQINPSIKNKTFLKCSHGHKKTTLYRCGFQWLSPGVNLSTMDDPNASLAFFPCNTEHAYKIWYLEMKKCASLTLAVQRKIWFHPNQLCSVRREVRRVSRWCDAAVGLLAYLYTLTPRDVSHS